MERDSSFVLYRPLFFSGIFNQELKIHQERFCIMLGLGDGFVLGAMLGTIAITLVCVVFGAINWNSGTGDDSK